MRWKKNLNFKFNFSKEKKTKNFSGKKIRMMQTPYVCVCVCEISEWWSLLVFCVVDGKSVGGQITTCRLTL